MSDQSNTQKIKRYADVSLVSALYTLGAVGVLHWLDRARDIITDPLSYYAVGAFGGLMTSAIAAFGASILSLAYALSRLLDVSRAGMLLLWNAGISFLIASIFPTDVTVNNLPITLVGAIHTIASYIASPSLVAAALLLTRRGEVTYFFALAGWLGLTVLVIGNHVQWHIGGLGQRVFLALVWIWLVLTTRRVRHLPPER
ncbi:MAG: DUF998 domain-containing protein [Anaerolineae bacterium]|nr:DUF998 domain-containing protein [Anaerolineae bacterium]